MWRGGGGWEERGSDQVNKPCFVNDVPSDYSTFLQTNAGNVY